MSVNKKKGEKVRQEEGRRKSGHVLGEGFGMGDRENRGTALGGRGVRNAKRETRQRGGGEWGGAGDCGRVEATEGLGVTR